MRFGDPAARIPGVRVHTLERSQLLPHPPEEAFAFFADAFNLEAITPPLLRFRVVTPAPIEMRPGTLIQYRLRLHGMGVDWLTRIDEWEPGVRFVDTQLPAPTGCGTTRTSSRPAPRRHAHARHRALRPAARAARRAGPAARARATWGRSSITATRPFNVLHKVKYTAWRLPPPTGLPSPLPPGGDRLVRARGGRRWAPACSIPFLVGRTVDEIRKGARPLAARGA